MRNFQRDGHMQMQVPRGRIAYEPSSLDVGPREDARTGYVSHPAAVAGAKLRQRPETFADHYSQARLFWRSMTPPEQRHIVGAVTFELSKVETLAVRKRMLGPLAIIEPELSERVAETMGMSGQAEVVKPTRTPVELAPSPALSLIAKAVPNLAGRKVGALVSDGCDAVLLAALHKALAAEGAHLELVAPRIGGVVGNDGKAIEVDHALAGAPSVFFDAVVVAVDGAGAVSMAAEAAAIDWIRDAYGHLKPIGMTSTSRPLVAVAQVTQDPGVISLDDAGHVDAYVTAVRSGRIWDRESMVRTPV